MVTQLISNTSHKRIPVSQPTKTCFGEPVGVRASAHDWRRHPVEILMQVLGFANTVSFVVIAQAPSRQNTKSYQELSIITKQMLYAETNICDPQHDSRATMTEEASCHSGPPRRVTMRNGPCETLSEP